MKQRHTFQPTYQREIIWIQYQNCLKGKIRIIIFSKRITCKYHSVIIELYNKLLMILFLYLHIDAVELLGCYLFSSPLQWKSNSVSHISIFRNENLDAYLGDYPILDYARVKLDPECDLRLLTQTFGEDGYGIGLPKGSPLKVCLGLVVLHVSQNSSLLQRK